MYLTSRMMKSQGPARHNWDNIFFVVDAFEVRHLRKGIRCGEKRISLGFDCILDLTLVSTS